MAWCWSISTCVKEPAFFAKPWRRRHFLEHSAAKDFDLRRAVRRAPSRSSKSQRRIRRRSQHKKTDQPKMKKSRVVVGLPGYNVSDQSGAASTMRSINLLKSASTEEEVDSLMTGTFAARRRAVVEDGASVQEIKTDYPQLFESIQFWKEVGRLAHNERALETYRGYLRTWLQKVAQKVVCKEEDALQQLEKLLCPRRQQLEDLPGPVKLSSSLPGEGYAISVDDCTVVKTESREEAVLALTMVHSVLNRTFSRSIRPMCMFVQRVVLNIDDGSKLPSAVAKLCHELQSPGE